MSHLPWIRPAPTEAPAFTREMKDAGAVYLGKGFDRSLTLFRGWCWWKGWDQGNWHGHEPEFFYAIHPEDPNFESVCREFGVCTLGRGRPHLWRTGGRWYCDSRGKLTSGPSPEEAFKMQASLLDITMGGRE